jgi:hypothetical protein
MLRAGMAALTVSLAGGGCAEQKAEGYWARRIPAQLNSFCSAEPFRGFYEYPPSLEDTITPLATEIENHLPKNLNPVFVYENDQQKQKGHPSFVVIGPVVLNQVIGDAADGIEPVNGISSSQGYLEFRNLVEDPCRRDYYSLKLSFSDYESANVKPLLKFRDSNPPDALFSIVVPLMPSSSWIEKEVARKQKILGLTKEEAEGYVMHEISTNVTVLSGREADNYLGAPNIQTSIHRLES